MRFTRALGMTAATALLLATAACGGDSLEDSGSSDDGSGGSADKGSVVVGGQDFTEMQVMASIYQQLLENEGYTVETKLVTTRDVYLPELSSGNVDIVPDYLAGITDYLNTEKNGPDAEQVSSNDVDATVAALEPLAEEQGISILPPSDATDQNAFFVSQEKADANGLKTLSDLAALGKPIKLGAPPDCEGRADCEGGLTGVYGFDITEIVPLDFGSSQVKDAVAKGEVDLGETGTTDASLADLGLVLLEDDKGIQPAQNLTPAVNSDFLADNPDLEDLFNELSAALTTEDLAAMNLKVDLERQKPEDVAQQFLEDKGLL
jgi:osmoprotectant transport system substrate-binding protein